MWDRASAVAHDTARAAAAWNTLRRKLINGNNDEKDRQTLQQHAAPILDDFDTLAELTADDGFKDRERALNSIETYRQITMIATLGALVLGILVALVLARRMVRPIADA